MRGKRNGRNNNKNKFKQFLISGLVPAIVIVVVLIGVLIWKVRAYDEKYRELTKCEVDRFMAGDPSSINAELGVDDQVFNSYRFRPDNYKPNKLCESSSYNSIDKQVKINSILYALVNYHVIKYG